MARLHQNGEAIYGTHPWERATGETSEGLHLRSTEKDSAVYATILGQPKSATIKSFTPKPGTQIFLLGEPKPLVRSQESDAVRITLPATLPGKYAYVLKFAAPKS